MDKNIYFMYKNIYQNAVTVLSIHLVLICVR